MKRLQNKKYSPWWTYSIAIALLLTAITLGLALGSTAISPSEVWDVLVDRSRSDATARSVRYVRLPRTVAALLCGAALSVSGAVIQGVLANRLASPSVIGVNAGAGLAVTLCAACGVLLDWRAPLGRMEGTEALCADCLERWECEELMQCGICRALVKDCLCMPVFMKRSRCSALCKLVYYNPRGRSFTQNRVIYHIKEHNDEKTAYFLAERLSGNVLAILEKKKKDRKDCIVTYLPRSRKAKLLHGTDQSKNLAIALAKLLRIPMQSLILRRRGANVAQKTLTAKQRRQNAKQAFFCDGKSEICGKTVILVDDLVTTGAGMAACTLLLRKMGASSVICVCVGTDAVNRDTGLPCEKTLASEQENIVFL